MQKQQNYKYVCGCGKAYSSYPALSNHKKTKHNNQNVQGSIIPRILNPKRGRPSYTYKKNTISLQKEAKNAYYEGLTIIELSLLDLDTKYKNKIIA